MEQPFKNASNLEGRVVGEETKRGRMSKLGFVPRDWRCQEESRTLHQEDKWAVRRGLWNQEWGYGHENCQSFETGLCYFRFWIVGTISLYKLLLLQIRQKKESFNLLVTESVKSKSLLVKELCQIESELMNVQLNIDASRKKPIPAVPTLVGDELLKDAFHVSVVKVVNKSANWTLDGSCCVFVKFGNKSINWTLDGSCVFASVQIANNFLNRLRKEMWNRSKLNWKMRILKSMSPMLEEVDQAEEVPWGRLASFVQLNQVQVGKVVL